MTLPTLDAIYPPGTFLAPRREDDGPTWAPAVPHMTEFMTANLIACAGRFPMLAHKAAMSPLGLATMERCGVEIGSAIEIYGTPHDYDLAIERRLRRGETVAYVYCPGSEQPTREPTLVGFDCLRQLNDKRNTPHYAGPENVPPRRSVNLRMEAERRSLRTPVVLKIPENPMSSGGLDVAVCHSRRQLRRSLRRFADAEFAVAETYVDAAQNWCIQFAVLTDGDVMDLGASEQLCLRKGIYAGNLLAADRSPPAAAMSLARAIAREGSKVGFRGICGFDILVDRQDKPFAIDLNFRPVASTAFVYEVIRRRAQAGASRLARLAFLKSDTPFPRLVQLCEDGFCEGWLVPLTTFDPEHGGLGPGPARLRVAILADDRRTLHRHEALLASRGIEFFRTPTRWDEIRSRLGTLF
jgi:hypothetical protein